jgi:DtxR family Mn-dependent transcriptional regulator
MPPVQGTRRSPDDQINKVVRIPDIKRMSMRASLREDYLEAILTHRARLSIPPIAHDLSNMLHIAEGDVHAHMDELVQQGDVYLLEDGRILLTEKGIATGKQIIKKHEVLQSFLTEILGMDRSSASDEACKIEHAVSDETIDRLDDYLRSPVAPIQSGVQEGPAGSCTGEAQWRSTCGISRSLVDFKEGERLIVTTVLGRGCSKRLMDLGVVPGQMVVIRRKLRNRSIVVQVKNCDVALSPEIASAICVERMP